MMKHSSDELMKDNSDSTAALDHQLAAAEKPPITCSMPTAHNIKEADEVMTSLPALSSEAAIKVSPRPTPRPRASVKAKPQPAKRDLHKSTTSAVPSYHSMTSSISSHHFMTSTVFSPHSTPSPVAVPRPKPRSRMMLSSFDTSKSYIV